MVAFSGVIKNLKFLGPEFSLIFFSSFLLLVGVFSERFKNYTGYIALFGVLSSAFLCIPLFGVKTSIYGNTYFVDNYSLFFKLAFCAIGTITILSSIDYVRRRGIDFAEYYALILFSLLGMMIMTSSRNFLMLFVGLETMSIPIYALCGIIQKDERSVEASMKYFFMGAFATGFFLFGISMIFGATGTLDLVGIRDVLSNTHIPSSEMGYLVAGLALLLVGFGFKVASVPFHMWTPDVYEGAPTAITGYMATGVKAAAFGALVRVFFTALPALQSRWVGILWFLAFLTMTVGNLTALAQRNVKRMLAYSSIAHAGYLLVGFTAGGGLGSSGILFYLLAYAFMSLGAFGVLSYLAGEDENYDLEKFSGLGYKRPLLALAMSVFLFSMAGIPPTAGFIGKFYLFASAVKKGFVGLTILAVINSAISVYYYLRVMVYMYFKESEGMSFDTSISPSGSISVALSSLGVLFLGVFPQYVFHYVQGCIRLIMG